MRIICLLAAVLLSACASQPPQSATYLLRSDENLSSRTLSAGTTTALGEVRVAIYIEQPGLVIATGDGKIRAARHHQWAEPLQVSLRRFLATEISGALGQDIGPAVQAGTTTRIDVVVDQLHGDGKGAALLVAFWEIASGGATESFQFSQTQALASDGYDALAAAERQLLKRLAAAIATSLKS